MKLEGRELEQFGEYEDFAREYVEHILNVTRGALEACDSPLEQRFLLTFLSYHGQSDNVYFWEEKCYRFFLEYQFNSFITIDVQRTLNVDGHRYRPDFLITYKTRDPLTSRLKIVVEIDGHDYHERTKEQARRDKFRDRTMTKAGFIVMRFTGSEIYREAQKAAEEVCVYIRAFERRLSEVGPERVWTEEEA